MVQLTPVPVDGGMAVGVVVELPGTRLVAAAVPAGYVMCGALDVALLDRLLGARRVVAGRALGVRSVHDLLERPLESVTRTARELGLREGMTGRQALSLLLKHGPASNGPAAPEGRLDGAPAASEAGGAASRS